MKNHRLAAKEVSVRQWIGGGGQLANFSRILGERVFPQRQLLLQSAGRIRHVSLPGWLQAVTLVTCLASAGAVSYLAVGYVHVRHALDDRQAVDAPVKSPAPVLASTVEHDLNAQTQQQNAAIAAMRDEIAALKDRYAALTDQSTALTGQLNEARGALTAMTAENGKLRGNLGLAEARAKTIEQARNDLDLRAHAAEQALNNKSGNVSQLAKNLDENRSELRESEAQRTTLQN